jgi:GT2 family glycosyltransferase
VTQLAVVVVSRDTKAFLRECLNSIFKETQALSLSVYVVDNGSTDGSPDMVESEFHAVHLIRSDVNLGFAAANNIALRRILAEEKCPYILLLNSDIVVFDRALEKMVDYLESRPEVGGAGPALILPDGRLQTGTGGYLPGARSAFNYFFFLHKLIPSRSKSFFLDQAAFMDGRKGPVESVPVEWLSGACLILRREVLEKVGLLDDSYYFYAEDVDWGRRMTEGGVRLVYVPAVHVIHHHGRTYEGARAGVNTLWLRMLYRYVRRERGWMEYALFRFFSILGFFSRLVGYSLARFLMKGPGRSGEIRELAGFLSYSVLGGAGNPRRPEDLR